MQNTPKKLGLWALVVGAILAIPLVTRAPWTLSDFIFAGVVLFGAASVFELVTKNMKNKTHKIVFGAAVLMAVILVWAWAVA